MIVVKERVDIKRKVYIHVVPKILTVRNTCMDNEEGNKEIRRRTKSARRRKNCLVHLRHNAKDNSETTATYGRSSWSRGSTRASVKSVRSSIQYRSVFDDVPVLSHQSLLALSSAISMQVAQMLGIQLGIPYEEILDMKTVNQPPVVTIFEILWEWRGKSATNDMVDDLVKCLNAINQRHFADIVTKVHKERRGLRRSDFRY